jgi:saccharopine dehydrogenase (NAD+, L-lysine-forming)
MKITNIVIRREYKINEFRTPLVPSDCKKCIEFGINIYVETSKQRCIIDKNYEIEGCIIIDDYTKIEFNKNETLILGLKELDYDNPKLLPYCHLYFTHIFKNQLGSEKIIDKLKEAKSIIYDYEYFLNKNQRRVIAFGFWAGFIGTAIGLLQHYYKSINQDILNLTPYPDATILIEELEYFRYFFIKLNIGIIGINGRCGKGARFILERLGLHNIHGYSRASDMEPLTQHHIIINCIKLSPDDNNTFISNEKLPKFDKLSVIVDISCDVFAKNNPILLNYNSTTFEKPVFKINDKIDIIAIDNLPSLLPKDSSEEFSGKLCKILLYKWNNLSPKLGII